MTKSACYPLHSSFSLPKQEALRGTHPLSAPTQELADSSGARVSDEAGLSLPVFRSYSYRLGHCDPGPLTAPLSPLSWANLGLSSDPQGLSLPQYHGYGSACEGGSLQQPLAAPLPDKEGILPLSSEENNVMPATYLPTLPYLDVQSAEDSSNDWHGQNNMSYPVGYPTLQSDYFHSSPMQDRSEVSSHTYAASGPRALYPTSDFTFSRRNLSDLASINDPYPPTPALSPPHEFDGSYRQNERDQRPVDEGEETDDNNIDSEPYAQLIGRALKSAPGHKMVLKDIYRWFEKNTNKARSGSKGWQNSIRHNLSMNGGFRKVDQEPPTDDAKRGFIWVLEPSALHEGVKSTTRYRKSGSNKRLVKPRHPAPERQRSGARGGKAARNFAKIRRSARHQGPVIWDPQDVPIPSIETSTSNMVDRSLSPPSVWTPDSTGSLTPGAMEHHVYSYEDIAGVTDAIPGPIFAEDDNDMSGHATLDYPSFVNDEVMASSLSRRLRRM
ncbi:MAG: hypothetical protein LQ352_006818 [Teloschistes flavicans]|nr:MAG: hypothetical protein LQ352_006818 [Teloschistes flavicans]